MLTQDIQDIIQSGSVAAVRKALKGIALDQNAIDTLFVCACQNGKASVIKHIQTLGTPTRAGIAQGVLTLIGNAKYKPALEYTEHITGTDINAKDTSGRTLLACSLRAGNQKLIDALIAKGADINLADKKGNHPLHWAFSAGKAKAAKTLFEHGVVLSSSQAASLLEKAPNQPLRDLVMHEFFKTRVSAMTREEFVAKWGEIKDLPSPVSMCEDPLGDEIMKGRFTSAGYFSAASGKNPHTDDLDWEAIDHAKTIAEALISALGGTEYVPGSEGGEAYSAFFIPALGRTPKTQDFDAHVSQEAKSESSGAYATYIQSESTYDKLFTGDYFSADEEFIDADTRALFMAANDVAQEHLSTCKKYLLYTDFVSFPVVFGGLDKFYNFVGVISHAVWT